MTLSIGKYTFGKYKISLIAILIAASLFFSTRIHAGQKNPTPVYYSQWTSGNTSNMVMSGQLADVRSSANGTDAIGCIVTYQTGGTPTGYCSASSGTAAAGGECQTIDPQFVQLIAGLKGDSNLYIYGTGPVGQMATCNFIWISNASYYSPKQP